jgi:hypothetical protein
MFGQRQRLRRTAALVLFGWLFALAAGIVNACVVEPQLRHGSVSAPNNSQHSTVAANPLHDAHAPGGSDHPSPHTGKAPCVKFCDEPSTVAKTLQLQIDPFSAAWLAPLSADPLPVEAKPLPAGGFRASHALWRPAIPIPIAFLRLSL